MLLSALYVIDISAANLVPNKMLAAHGLHPWCLVMPRLVTSSFQSHV